MKKKVLVTGAAGFIGSNLTQMLLDEGFPVIGLDNLSAGTLANIPQRADFRKVDICESDLDQHFEGIDTVFHLAAKNCLADCAANPVETSLVNVMGTANVLWAAQKNGVKHFIYADTSAEYEGIEEFPSVIEKIKPLSIYACSKRGGALVCEAFQNLHSMQVSMVRYFNVYGPAQDWRRIIPPVMSAFTIHLLKKQQPVIYGTGEKRRDFIHVDDVNRFHLMLLEDPAVRGKIYNLGTGVDYSMLQVFELIESQIQSGLTPVFKPDLPAEAFRTLADTSETLRTGWAPRVSLEQGLRDFIQYTRERLQI